MKQNDQLENVEKLEFPWVVLKRPGLYGHDCLTPNILFRELADNTVDLALKTRQPVKVNSLINKKDWNLIYDDAGGMPLYLDKDYPDDKDRPITLDLLSKLNVGTNFSKTSYSLGMHGLGGKLTVACSSTYMMFVNAEKQKNANLPNFIRAGLESGKPIVCFKFHKGILDSQTMMTLEEVKNYPDFPDQKDIKKFLEELDNSFGTLIAFHPIPEMHESMTISYHGYPMKLMKGLFQHDKELENIKVDFKLNGKELDPYSFDDVFKEELVSDKVLSCSVTCKTEEPLPMKFIFQVGWSKSKWNLDTDGSVNLLKTPAGKHINIVMTGISQAFSKYNNLIKQQDSRLGMRLFVLNFAIEPLFNSQDKTKLSKWEDIGYDERATIQAISDAFYKVMKSNTEFFDVLCARILEYKRATEKLSNIELLKSKIVLGDEGDKRRIQSGEMSKVYDCTTNNPSKNELFIVEGLSAVASILVNRDKRYQAAIPLRGKMKNTSGLDEEALVSNKEVTAIINTIGCGIGGITDISKSRYDKVIIATDADNDGCLTGDTLIPLLDGRKVPISELKNEESFWVYSCTEDGNIVPGLGHSARVTKQVDKIYRITLDNGKTVECTDNHPFMLRSGKFERADKLVVGDSLMPFYTRYGKNTSYGPDREELYNPKTKSWIMTHRQIAGYAINYDWKDGYHVHHIDGTVTNNRPDNLTYISRAEHISIHAKDSYLVTKWNGSEQQQEFLKTNRMKEVCSNNGKNSVLVNSWNGIEDNSKTASERNSRMWNSTEIYKDGMTYSEWMSKQLSERSEETLKILSENCSSQWKDEEISYNMQFSRCCSVILSCIEQFGELSEKGYNLLKPRTGVPKYSSLFEKFGDQTNLDLLIRTKQFVDKFPNKLQGFPNATEYFKEFNHSIISIEVVELESPIEVWDITVEEHHNFALESGCFVHNSHIMNLILGLFLHHCPELVKAGKVYHVEPPFYRVTDKKGKVSYFWHDEKDKIDFENCKVDKLKGLGSYNDKEAKEFLMNPETRRLIQFKYDENHQVEIDDAVTLLFSAAKRKQLMIDSGIFVEGKIK